MCSRDSLTILALRSAPARALITAFEVNPHSANHAREALRTEAGGAARIDAQGFESRVKLVVGRSTQPELLGDRGDATWLLGGYDVVLHEVRW